VVHPGNALIEYAVKTIYIGGGTPSILAPFFILRILEKIREVFDVSADAEITIEANPGTLDADRLKVYREAGITG
jgi:oxygen-independent coproporphyrinogen-3 oxidase